MLRWIVCVSRRRYFPILIRRLLVGRARCGAWPTARFVGRHSICAVRLVSGVAAVVGVSIVGAKTQPRGASVMVDGSWYVAVLEPKTNNASRCITPGHMSTRYTSS